MANALKIEDGGKGDGEFVRMEHKRSGGNRRDGQGDAI